MSYYFYAKVPVNMTFNSVPDVAEYHDKNNDNNL